MTATPENLGYSGAPPSHPALLEELARYLVEAGWSAKALNRLIVTSRVYRQASATEASVAESHGAENPDTGWLGRFPIRRLDAEAIRDAMLAASGEINERMGGPYVSVSRKESGVVQVEDSVEGAHRRSVYLQQRRTHVVGVLEDFDAPSIVVNCTRRNATTIPLQSLSLLNSEFVRGRAACPGPAAGERVRFRRRRQSDAGVPPDRSAEPPTEDERSARAAVPRRPAGTLCGENRCQ